MLKKSSAVFTNLLNHIMEMPVIDCHDHICGPDRDLKGSYVEPILMLISPYLVSDMVSAGAHYEEIALLQRSDASTDEKWPVFNRLWNATEHATFSQVVKIMLRKVYKIDKLTRHSLDDIAKEMKVHDHSYYMKTLEDAGIKAVIADILMQMSWEGPVTDRYFGNHALKEFLEGKMALPDMWHPVFPLPYFHEFRHYEFINFVSSVSNSNVTSLKEYEEMVFNLIDRCKSHGVIALKDQSAYLRIISYDLPARSDAERIFNRILVDPRNQLSWSESKPLGDYLFHQYMRFASELHLPVQIHTGYVAGDRNRVEKANAAHLASVLELHSDVQFDLFHGNWPYMGDLLFLAKNYPNVFLDLCWSPVIDPLYTEELIKHAIMTVPHVKIHGFGGDFILSPEYVVAHLELARSVIARALSDLVECDWLEEHDAMKIASDWLFNSPNRFYNLGL
jgi:hypothetical protein